MLSPLNDQVLVEPEIKETPIGIIVVPENAKKKRSQTGWAVRVGPKCREVKAGDKIILPEYGGTDIKINGRQYRVVRESDVTAVIKTKEK